ncbi:MAG: response regulator transcription factor [Flavobacteriales bacterium]|jgi:DNA-binding LytR/AlgR family response regulator|nr:response regulator transcription factor [Flavobacteriales bacterium]
MNTEFGIFIVEDKTLTRLALEIMIKNNGFAFIGSEPTAEKAYELISENKSKVDLVLVDINLAGENDGFWLGKKLKDLEIPFVIITAYNDSKTLQGIIRSGAETHIMKPFVETNVITNIKLILEKYAKKDEEPDFIYIKSNRNKIKIDLKKVHFVKSEGNYIILFYDDQNYILRNSIPKFLEENTRDYLVRTHRRYIINLSRIDQFNSKEIVIKDEIIPISGSFKDHFNSRWSEIEKSNR